MHLRLAVRARHQSGRLSRQPEAVLAISLRFCYRVDSSTAEASELRGRIQVLVGCWHAVCVASNLTQPHAAMQTPIGSSQRQPFEPVAKGTHGACAFHHHAGVQRRALSGRMPGKRAGPGHSRPGNHLRQRRIYRFLPGNPAAVRRPGQPHPRHQQGERRLRRRHERRPARGARHLRGHPGVRRPRLRRRLANLAGSGPGQRPGHGARLVYPLLPRHRVAVRPPTRAPARSARSSSPRSPSTKCSTPQTSPSASG